MEYTKENMNSYKNEDMYLYSFGIEQDDNEFDEWNLSDELLSEDVKANKPTSISNLSENMDNTLLSRRDWTIQSVKDNEKSQCFTSHLAIPYLGKFKSWKIEDSQLLDDSKYASQKLSLKDDIKFLLNWLVQEKKKKWNSEVNQFNQENIENLYVSMKDIEAIEID